MARQSRRRRFAAGAARRGIVTVVKSGPPPVPEPLGSVGAVHVERGGLLVEPGHPSPDAGTPPSGPTGFVHFAKHVPASPGFWTAGGMRMRSPPSSAVERELSWNERVAHVSRGAGVAADHACLGAIELRRTRSREGTIASARFRVTGGQWRRIVSGVGAGGADCFAARLLGSRAHAKVGLADPSRAEIRAVCVGLAGALTKAVSFDGIRGGVEQVIERVAGIFPGQPMAAVPSKLNVHRQSDTPFAGPACWGVVSGIQIPGELGSVGSALSQN